jgi:hypothetical protein
VKLSCVSCPAVAIYPTGVEHDSGKSAEQTNTKPREELEKDI